ncbi:hypothetical protein [Streptomyces aquilus]|uniref:hypothetical protein n=1 Tax=Streptomyces aquilus TaxID=2548456 RepID=UPI0036929F31
MSTTKCCGTIPVVDDRTRDVDWSGLFHALGPASDTPRHLAALLGKGARASVDGYSHLWSATLRREGKAWPATAPTAILVAELLDNPLLGLDDPSLPDAMLADTSEAVIRWSMTTLMTRRLAARHQRQEPVRARAA